MPGWGDEARELLAVAVELGSEDSLGSYRAKDQIFFFTKRVCLLHTDAPTGGLFCPFYQYPGNY